MFSDDMVLQRGSPISVRGTADPKERIQVCFNASSVTCRTDAKGYWSASLPAEKSGGPYTLIIKTEGQTVTFRNILVGDIWFASGQSNMEHPLEGWRWVPNSDIYRGKEEIADSDYPEIRLFTVPRYPSSTPVRDVPEGKWEVAGPEAVRRFSSTAWFFGKELYAKLSVPIGIIHCSWAGTSIKTWASKEVIGQFKDSAGIQAVLPIPSREEVIKVVKENQERRCLISYPKEGQVDEVNQLPLSAWQPVTIPGIKKNWQEVVWLKKEIDMSEAAAKEVQELSLGFLKGQSIVYFNGTKIGYYAYPEPVVALVPRQLVCPGKNTLTVRLAIPFGSPEAEGDPGLFYLSARNHGERCELSGEWLATTCPDTIPASLEEYRNFTSALFNGMVNPCMQFGIKGVIWYQGEDDANRPQLYEKMFNALVQDWRKKWNITNLPFLYVQVTDGLISPQGEEDTSRRIFQGYQKLSLQGTGMVISRDVGDPYDVHPRNKKEIGNRLARKALEMVY